MSSRRQRLVKLDPEHELQMELQPNNTFLLSQGSQARASNENVEHMVNDIHNIYNRI